ncbi:MAG: amidohydrolase family protein, partial [Actinomycetota bacterium]
MNDYVIKGGLVVDGTGATPRTADIAVRGGLIVEIGSQVSAEAREVIDADGAVVTPGWVDVHTHYDGQVSWDDVMDPSAG